MSRLWPALRMALLLPPVFCLALWLMLPSLVRERMPVQHWPAAVLYGLFVGGRR